MTPESIAEIITERFPDAVVETKLDSTHPHIVVKPEAWPEVAQFVRDDPRLHFDWLRCISGVDLLEDQQFAVVYDFHSTRPPSVAQPDRLWSANHAFAIKVKLPRDIPHIATVTHLWGAADWHERETYDLLGIVFDGHPDSVEGPDGPHPRRILCADDWVGFPLRKDYEFPLEYHGIPATTEYNQTRPQH